MFENPENLLWLALILPLAWAFFRWRERARARALARLGDPDLIRQLTAGSSPARRRLRNVLWTVALSLLLVALARPVWGVDIEVIEARGLAVVFVLDVSISMDAQDILPSRLERARQTISDVMNTAGDNLYGLVLFAADAFVQFPLTSDVDSAQVFVSAVSSRSVSRQGTAIETALDLAMTVFDERIAGESIIILLSDGENHEGDVRAAARRAAERGIPIEVIGYGTTDGDLISVYDAAGEFVEYKTDRAGNLVITRLDETILEDIAQLSGGVYQRATESGVEVVNLLNRLLALDVATTQAGTRTRNVERFGIFLALAWLALTVEMFLPEAKRT